ncbi:MAG: aminoglycoside phosphotransferase family protein [Clostridiales bacterium]|nr:aminoglycoside phosphotransferase family protein [Clostridiales bacterium]
MITKNRQPDSVIHEMIRKAFPEKTATDIQELTEGMCNVTYNITFSDGEECILKIAAKDTTGNTSNEIRLMTAEVKAMQLVREHCTFHVADVLAYDCSRTICDGDYFFMEKLPGVNYSFIKENLPEETRRGIAREIGEISRQLRRITNPQFGFLGDTKRYDHLSDFVHTMLRNLITDGQKKNVDLGCDVEKLLEEFEEEKYIFDEVPSATLVHWDMWEGNVFVEGEHVSGIIDWERAMWGEAFMDDRFRKHSRNKDFLEGFGQKDFSETELMRIRWYDIILYLTMMVEVFYREFEDKGQYFWAKEQFLSVLHREAT